MESVPAISHFQSGQNKCTGGSPDGDGGAFPYQRVKSGGIPVRKADAAMASGAAYGIGDGAAVDDYAGVVQSGSEDAESLGSHWGLIGVRYLILTFFPIRPRKPVAWRESVLRPKLISHAPPAVLLQENNTMRHLTPFSWKTAGQA